VTYLASSGDGGYGLYQPASFTHVIAVGGTFLNNAARIKGDKKAKRSTAKSSGPAQAADAPIR